MATSNGVTEDVAHTSNISERLDELAASLKTLLERTDSSADSQELPERVSILKAAEMIGVRPCTVRKMWARYGLIRSGRGRHGRTFYKTESVLRYLRRRDAGGC